ncbi:malonate transporter subunit MadL [Pseudomonas sp. RIT-To-2]|uniref:malonate transporter subunit MadL n=1 Tax=Pseudomonas sp. RIT-To-2 TaxID=3462541 RepID=UPI00241377D4
MIIYGVALLAICTLAGVITGDMLGVLLGVKSNVGGVGIAMILLICARLYMGRQGGLSKDCEMGVGFWGALYIPVVVAMAAQQNVVTALHGGPVAVIAAIGSVLICGATIALISRTHKGEPLPPEEPVAAQPLGAR